MSIIKKPVIIFSVYLSNYIFVTYTEAWKAVGHYSFIAFLMQSSAPNLSGSHADTGGMSAALGTKAAGELGLPIIYTLVWPMRSMVECLCRTVRFVLQA